MASGVCSKLFLGFLFNTVHCFDTPGKDNGFGRNYVWARSLESGLKMVTNHKMPAMLIIHKPMCPACKNLKPKIASSPEIQDLSKHFVMINVLDEDAPKSTSFAPDGYYVPRILFLKPNGMVDHEIYNEDGSIQHKYFYSRPEQIAKAMRYALRKYEDEKFNTEEEDPDQPREGN